jgi:(1->4)-alpha-D-glucan 1-alpha-D-glucosylmutase
VVGFVRDALDTSRPNAFLSAFLPFQERLARLGIRNSLVQTALKLTLPGMPDIYQGAELWDLSLVDPDNRRPVDYEARIELLDQVTALFERNRHAALFDMLANWRDGRVKLAVIATLLAYRRDRPMLFAQGGYEPLIATGPRADQICAFVRCHDQDALVVTAARFPVRSDENCDWTGTEIFWPQAAGGETHWRDLLCGRVVECRSEAINVEALLGDMPVAVFVPDAGRRRI